MWAQLEFPAVSAWCHLYASARNRYQQRVKLSPESSKLDLWLTLNEQFGLISLLIWIDLNSSEFTSRQVEYVNELTLYRVYTQRCAGTWKECSQLIDQLGLPLSSLPDNRHVIVIRLGSEEKLGFNIISRCWNLLGSNQSGGNVSLIYRDVYLRGWNAWNLSILS